jgi:hypothetical protein
VHGENKRSMVSTEQSVGAAECFDLKNMSILRRFSSSEIQEREKQTRNKVNREHPERGIWIGGHVRNQSEVVTSTA